MQDVARTYQKSGWIIVLELLIIIVSIIGLIYVYGINDNTNVKIGVGILLVVGLIGVFVVKGRAANPVIERATGITKVVLLDEDGESTKEWYIHGGTSLLIGKSTPEHEVDIDLADTEYAALISKQHAVLNHASGQWYIEDVDSRNGTGIQKSNHKSRSKLEQENPQKLESGDIIYIASTRLMIK
ncbi:FHA domain-containing protein [Brevibacillus sp. SYSU BS000544]|uniref:FHA domain-containing protein n=1 Tax=Brevibacillus sp. SYSU BS000544 TaxID=3416443 RepID=UPI003CE45151